MNFPQTKPIEVVIQAPAPTSWQWNSSMRHFDTGEFCPPRADDSLTLSMQLRDLGSFKKTPEVFCLTATEQGVQSTKLKAIKVVRELSGMGLKEAKELVEGMLFSQKLGIFTYKFDCCL